MSFVNFPFWLVVTGAFSLIALLYALQHLKAQPVVLRVASVQLWQEALQHASANKFWQRFRHWLGFLLAVLIALLLWLAISGIRFTDSTKPLHVFYLDTSVAMQAGDNMTDAKAELVARLPSSSSANRELWIGDAVPAKILSADSSNAVLTASLSTIQASSHLPAFSEWLERVPTLYAGQPVVVHYFGSALGNITAPDGIALQNDFISAAISANAGITAIGQQRFMTDNEQVSRVTFTLLSSVEQQFQPDDITVLLNDSPVDAARIIALQDNQFAISGIPLTDQPQRLTVSLNEADSFSVDSFLADSFLPDNSATLMLPAKSQIFVALQDGLPDWVTRFVDANPQLTVDPERASVSICINRDDTCPASGATLYADDSSNAVTFYTPISEEQSSLQKIWQAYDWSDPAYNMPSMQVLNAETKSVSMPLSYLGQLVEKQQADPLLLLSMAINWLTDLPVAPAYLAVGEAAPVLPGDALTQSNAINPFPLTISQFKEGDAVAMASLQSPVISRQVASARDTSGSVEADTGSDVPWLTIIILTALGLLIVEWLMIQRGRWA
ncbi:BatA domain-containing protein [Alteromonas confluentis]|uniref:Uncharacterized protein n=1 Tax=Alteromonas confluentis TaxID=1656094 RepID=A0A1E7Z8Q0_9ALTE|nr:BatA domain-containing protein [Alteromonas confluentis]OFC69908.1 hypothetical protein BFC18_00440 [Alteromonas confluentis]